MQFFKVFPLVICLVNMYITDTVFLCTQNFCLLWKQHPAEMWKKTPLSALWTDREWWLKVQVFGSDHRGWFLCPGLLALFIILDKSLSDSKPQFDDYQMWTTKAPINLHRLLRNFTPSEQSTSVAEGLLTSTALTITPTAILAQWGHLVSWPRTSSLGSSLPLPGYVALSQDKGTLLEREGSKFQQWLGEPNSPTPAKAEDFIQVHNDLQKDIV